MIRLLGESVRGTFCGATLGGARRGRRRNRHSCHRLHPDAEDHNEPDPAAARLPHLSLLTLHSLSALQIGSAWGQGCEGSKNGAQRLLRCAYN